MTSGVKTLTSVVTVKNLSVPTKSTMCPNAFSSGSPEIQPPLGVPAEITDPPVVGAGVGGSEVYVFHFGFPQ